MRKRFVLVLLAVFAAGALGSGPPPASRRVEQTHDLAALSFREAVQLQGRRAKYRITIDSRPEERDGHVVYDCTSADGVLATVWLPAPAESDAEDDGPAAGDVLTVTATLRVRYVPPGHGFPGFWEYRLAEARR